MDEDDLDARLRSLLAEPDPPVDPAFVARVTRAIDIERSFSTARARAWKRFAIEALATASVGGALLLSARIAPVFNDGNALTFGPAAIGTLAMLLWLGVAIGQPARAR